MNVVRPARSRPGACLVLDARAPLPPGPYGDLAHGDLLVILAAGARLVPGGSAIAAVERAVRQGIDDLVVCASRGPRVPSWAADLEVDPVAHVHAQLLRALSSKVIVDGVHRGLRLHAWVHDPIADEVTVVVGGSASRERLVAAVG